MQTSPQVLPQLSAYLLKYWCMWVCVCIQTNVNGYKVGNGWEWWNSHIIT